MGRLAEEVHRVGCRESRRTLSRLGAGVSSRSGACFSTQMRNHHLQMEEHYNTLAQAEELAALAHALGD